MDRLYSNLHPNEHPAPLPMFTSCCPGWVEQLEKRYPEMIPHVSSTKSPHMVSQGGSAGPAVCLDVVLHACKGSQCMSRVQKTACWPALPALISKMC